jgi:hypothetical protein
VPADLWLSSWRLQRGADPTHYDAPWIRRFGSFSKSYRRRVRGSDDHAHVAVWNDPSTFVLSAIASGTKRADRQGMPTLAFGGKVLKFPVQGQALVHVTGAVEVRAEGVIPFHERSVVQAGEFHAINAKPSSVRNRGYARPAILSPREPGHSVPTLSEVHRRIRGLTFSPCGGTRVAYRC